MRASLDRMVSGMDLEYFSFNTFDSQEEIVRVGNLYPSPVLPRATSLAAHALYSMCGVLDVPDASKVISIRLNSKTILTY
jgi:hypothetical protein